MGIRRRCAVRVHAPAADLCQTVTTLPETARALSTPGPDAPSCDDELAADPPEDEAEAAGDAAAGAAPGPALTAWVPAGGAPSERHDVPGPPLHRRFPAWTPRPVTTRNEPLPNVAVDRTEPCSGIGDDVVHDAVGPDRHRATREAPFAPFERRASTSADVPRAPHSSRTTVSSSRALPGTRTDVDAHSPDRERWKSPTTPSLVHDVPSSTEGPPAAGAATAVRVATPHDRAARAALKAPRRATVTHDVSEPLDRSRVPPPARTSAKTVPPGAVTTASATGRSAEGSVPATHDFPSLLVRAIGEYSSLRLGSNPAVTTPGPFDTSVAAAAKPPFDATPGGVTSVQRTLPAGRKNTCQKVFRTWCRWPIATTAHVPAPFVQLCSSAAVAGAP